MQASSHPSCRDAAVEGGTSAPDGETQLARRRFPAGLEQPEGSFRFSIDALLLAAFAARRSSPYVTGQFADLGTGCGVIGLAYMLLNDNIYHGFGIDCDETLAASAARNAARLALANRFVAFHTDLKDIASLRIIRNKMGSADLIMANPPWRLLGTGRTPMNAARRKALFGDAETFPSFTSAASILLRQGGRFTGIVGAQRLADLLAALTAARLQPALLRFVHKKWNTPAIFVLVEARKAAHADFVVEAPLVLYGEDGIFTPESLEFCPFLR